uniref:Uncharacterized protein n=1 Tax=Chrysemys picta bellii TaxID=8478 RepID=A0A8C3FYG3_CHRPI
MSRRTHARTLTSVLTPQYPPRPPSSMRALSLVRDKTIAAPLPSVPQEDFKAHQDLLKRVASNLQLQTEEMEGPSDTLFNVLSPTALGHVALPLHQGIANISTSLWYTPTSLAPSSKKAKRKYFVLAKDHEYLYSHPAPNSLIVESVNHREHQGQHAPTPKNKDTRRLDSFGRKFYLSTSFQLRVANHQALLSRYDFNLWEFLPKFEPDWDRKDFKALVEEGSAVAKAALQAASDAVDMEVHSMASAIAMRRASWLLLSGLSMEAQSLMQDLPFNGKALFVDQMDIRLHGMKDSHATLQTLGLYVPPAKDKAKSLPAAQPVRSRYEPPYKRPRDQKCWSQQQSRSAPQPGPSKGKRQGKRQF